MLVSSFFRIVCSFLLYFSFSFFLVLCLCFSFSFFFFSFFLVACLQPSCLFNNFAFSFHPFNLILGAGALSIDHFANSTARGNVSLNENHIYSDGVIYSPSLLSSCFLLLRNNAFNPKHFCRHTNNVHL